MDADAIARICAPKVWVVYTDHYNGAYVEGVFLSKGSANKKKRTLTASGALDPEMVKITQRKTIP